MGSFSFRIPAGADLSDVFKNIPESARKFLREGFDVLAHIFPEYSDLLLKLPVETFVPDAEPNLNEFATSLHLSLSQARNLMAAMNFLALTATPPAPSTPGPKVVAGMADAGLLEARAKQPADVVLGHFLKESGRIDAAFRRAIFSSAVWPSISAVRPI